MRITDFVELIAAEYDNKLKTPKQIDEQDLLSDLKSACREDDATRVRNLLGRWLRRYGPGQAHGSVMEFARQMEDPALAKAIKDFPMINVSVDGDNIIVKEAINIGMATALPSGNLIVPVIHNADNYNLTGLAKKVNSLAAKARKRMAFFFKSNSVGMRSNIFV